MKKILAVILVGFGLASCVAFDESTYIVDDAGVRHHTVHYTLDYRGRSNFPQQIKPTGQRLFVFDPKAYAWAAYDAYGRRVMTGAASGGMDYCEDIKKPCRTVTGSFRMYYKKGADCFSKAFPVETAGGAKMPYCMYFYRGYSIHAGYQIPYANSSHGCIKVNPSAAKWLNEVFMQKGTEIIVLSYADENGNDKSD